MPTKKSIFQKVKDFFHAIIYKLKFLNEIRIHRNKLNIHQLPEIFHYWSNKYLLPKEQKFGFNNPDEFFLKYCKESLLNSDSTDLIQIVSVGSGNGELEIYIAKELLKSLNLKFPLNV